MKPRAMKPSTQLQIVGIATAVFCTVAAAVIRDVLLIYAALAGVYLFVIALATRPLKEEKKESPFKRAKQLIEEGAEQE